MHGSPLHMCSFHNFPCLGWGGLCVTLNMLARLGTVQNVLYSYMWFLTVCKGSLALIPHTTFTNKNRLHNDAICSACVIVSNNCLLLHNSLTQVCFLRQTGIPGSFLWEFTNKKQKKRPLIVSREVNVFSVPLYGGVFLFFQCLEGRHHGCGWLRLCSSLRTWLLWFLERWGPHLCHWARGKWVNWSTTQRLRQAL